MLQPSGLLGTNSTTGRPKIWRVILALALGIWLTAAPARAADAPKPGIELLSPAPGAVVIAKKPLVRFNITRAPAGGKLLVLLDTTDITEVLQRSPQGFSFTPLQVLAAGKHTLTIKITGPGDAKYKKSFTFTIRHSKALREAYGQGELTVVYQGKLHRSSESTDPPGSSLESNLSGNLVASEGGWKAGLKFNLRYLDQSTPVEEPLSKGVNLADYLLDLKYTRGEFGFFAQLGDVVINHTENTAANLARRGGRLAASVGGLRLSVFSVNSAQYYGFYGGLGVSPDTDQHIHGASASLSLFSEAAELKLVYLSGGETDPGAGGADSGDRRRGSVWGLQVKTNFFQDRLVTDLEIDFSRYDPVGEAEAAYNHDRAYRLGASGKWGAFFYGGKYQYFGRDYAVVGNSEFEANRAGLSLFGGAEFTGHAFQVAFSRFRDNVDDEPTQPVTHAHELSLEYSFTGIKHFSTSFNYTLALDQTSREPEDIQPKDTHTHSITHTIAYLGQPWAVEFTAGYSHQYDRTDDQGNTIVTNFSLSPTYSSEKFTLVPTVSYDRSTAEATDVHTETWTVNLDIRGNLDKLLGFPSGRFSYGLTGTYTRVRASDDSAKTDTTSAALELSYFLGDNVWPGMKPSVGLRLRYDRTMDYQSGQGDEDLSVFLVLQTSLPYSF